MQLQAMGRCLSAEELDLLIAGQRTLDLDEWQEHTLYYESGYTLCYNADSLQVLWFWEMLRGWEPAKRSSLLAFVTGAETIGPSGFARASAGLQRPREQVHHSAGSETSAGWGMETALGTNMLQHIDTPTL